jgi:hypothetical protein
MHNDGNVTMDYTNIPQQFDLPEGWQRKILDMYELGYPNDEVIAWILKNRECKRFSKNTFARWRDINPEFKEVITQGQILKKAWWLQQGRENVKDCKFNVPLYIRMMGNMFGWKSEITKAEVNDNRLGAPDLSGLSDEELEIYKTLMKKGKTQKKEDIPTEERLNGETTSESKTLPGRFGVR